LEANKKIFFVTDEKLMLSEEFKQLIKEIDVAISSIVWHLSDKFIINPIRKGNGVVPIKENFIKYLVSKNWIPEYRLSFTEGINPGPVDVVKETSKGLFAVEWETGNISSSHRALNKIAIGIMHNKIIGGILILPTKVFANYLTDRIGNFEEIQPYFSLYTKKLDRGIMGVFAVEHDGTSEDAPIIPKGKDGNAKK